MLEALKEAPTLHGDSQHQKDFLEETKIDRETMGRLAKALAFINSPDDPVVVALRASRGVRGSNYRDIKQARTLFLRLRPSDRRAALASLTE